MHCRNLDSSARPTRRQRLPFAALATLAVVLALLSGCSRIYTSTTPFGDKEHRVDSMGAANRVNGWPLFYQFDDKMSVLWPLFQKSDDGFVVWPLAEHSREDVLQPGGNQPQHNRTLVGLGILGYFSQLDRFYRVGPAWVDTRDNHCALFPMFFSGWDSDPWVVLFPLAGWFQRDSGKDTFLSLPFSRGKDFFNIGGLGYHFAKDSYASPPYTYETRHYLLGGLGYLAHRDDGGVRAWHALPFYRYQREGDETKRFGLLGLLYATRDLNEDAPYRAHHILPFYRYQCEGNETKRYGLMGLIYAAGDKGEDAPYRTRHVMPLYRCRSEGAPEDPDLSLLNIGGILYRSKVEKDGNKAYRSILWPLSHRWRSEKRSIDVVAPLYYRRKEGDLSTLATPLFCLRRDGAEKWFSLGYFLFNYIEEGDAKAFVSPLASWGDLGENEGFANVGGVLFHHYWKGDRYFTYLTPLIGGWSGPVNRGKWLFPLFAHSESDFDSEYLSPLLSFGSQTDGRWWANLGILLGWIGKAPEKLDVAVLANILGYNMRAGRTNAHLFPLAWFSKWNTEKGDKGHSATLFPLFHREKSRDTVRWPMAYRKTAPPPPLDMDTTPTLHRSVVDASRWSALLFVGGRTRNETPRGESTVKLGESYREAHLWPLWKYEKTENLRSESKALFGAIWNGKTQVKDENGKKVEHVRNRLLWRLFDYERKARTVSVDMFPFITWDRDPDREYRAFSFFGPLVRRVKKGDASRWQVLGIPFGDKVELHQPTDG